MHTHVGVYPETVLSERDVEGGNETESDARRHGSWHEVNKGAANVDVAAVETEIDTRRANCARIAGLTTKGDCARVQLQALGFDVDAEFRVYPS
jgi:hypothetical protein